MFSSISKIAFISLLGVATASCTTTRESFNANPKAVDRPTLCRTFLKTPDPNFIQDLIKEMQRRGLNPYECPSIVQKQDAAAGALIAVALVGTAVAVCANNNCGGGYAPPRQYRGNCQYNWQYDAAGNRCGQRSAYARPGGYY